MKQETSVNETSRKEIIIASIITSVVVILILCGRFIFLHESNALKSRITKAITQHVENDPRIVLVGGISIVKDNKKMEEVKLLKSMMPGLPEVKFFKYTFVVEYKETCLRENASPLSSMSLPHTIPIAIRDTKEKPRTLGGMVQTSLAKSGFYKEMEAGSREKYIGSFGFEKGANGRWKGSGGI